ncbi:hypothetical protein M758_12G096600 [Ceratodon purpureus]|nr:hypothetical protein M758_12G096600 [Ceratodon purpureus]
MRMPESVTMLLRNRLNSSLLLGKRSFTFLSEPAGMAIMGFGGCKKYELSVSMMRRWSSKSSL